MLKVHHLNNSRSQRILWLLEELGLDYELIKYQRDAVTNLAPPELLNVHPLGKSPVISVDGKVIAESGTIIEYIARVPGKGRFAPAENASNYWDYMHWMHYAEGSVMLPILLNLYVSRLGEAGAPLHPRIQSETANHYGYMNKALANQPYFAGQELTACDFQMSFPVEIMGRARLVDYPNLLAFLDRIQARPAYQRALEKGGAYAFGQ
jgi:glutathione S-transferase